MSRIAYKISAGTFWRSTSTTWLPRRSPALRLQLNGSRNVSTLSENPHIYAHKHPLDPSQTLLSLLSTEPAVPQLAIGTTTTLPPSPRAFTANPSFLSILSSVYATHATSDPHVIQQAAIFASPGGGFLQPGSNDGVDGGVGGFIHVSDLRNPPDFGRIAWPEDILGSVEVNRRGELNEGTWQDSGTYRVITREGILGLTDFMRGKLIERLQQLEREIKEK